MRRPPVTRAEHEARAEVASEARASALESAVRWLELAGHVDAAKDLRRSAASNRSEFFRASGRSPWTRARLEAAARVACCQPLSLFDVPQAPRIQLARELYAFQSFVGGHALMLFGDAELEPTAQGRALLRRALAVFAERLLDIVEPHWRDAPWLTDGDEPEINAERWFPLATQSKRPAARWATLWRASNTAPSSRREALHAHPVN